HKADRRHRGARRASTRLQPKRTAGPREPSPPRQANLPPQNASQMQVTTPARRDTPVNLTAQQDRALLLPRQNESPAIPCVYRDREASQSGGPRGDRTHDP